MHVFRLTWVRARHSTILVHMSDCLQVNQTTQAVQLQRALISLTRHFQPFPETSQYRSQLNFMHGYRTRSIAWYHQLRQRTSLKKDTDTHSPVTTSLIALQRFNGLCATPIKLLQQRMGAESNRPVLTARTTWREVENTASFLQSQQFNGSLDDIGCHDRKSREELLNAVTLMQWADEQQLKAFDAMFSPHKDYVSIIRLYARKRGTGFVYMLVQVQGVTSALPSLDIKPGELLFHVVTLGLFIVILHQDKNITKWQSRQLQQAVNERSEAELRGCGERARLTMGQLQ